MHFGCQVWDVTGHIISSWPLLSYLGVKRCPSSCNKSCSSCPLLCICAQPAAAGSTELTAWRHHCRPFLSIGCWGFPLKACPGCCCSFAGALNLTSSPRDALDMLPPAGSNVAAKGAAGDSFASTHICLAAATLTPHHQPDTAGSSPRAPAFVDGVCTCREHSCDDTVSCLQAALAAEDAAADLARDPDEDAWSQASSVVSGMSAYTSATGNPLGASAAASSSGRPASTVGGRRPAKNKKGKVGKKGCNTAHQLVTSAATSSKRPINNGAEQDGSGHGWSTCA